MHRTCILILRKGDRVLAAALEEGLVLSHPFVIGELACGTIRQRAAFLADLERLPRAVVAAHDEVMGLVERYRLAGSGIGWVDAHLLAAARCTPRTPHFNAPGR